jgi:hypothetical protein
MKFLYIVLINYCETNAETNHGVYLQGDKTLLDLLDNEDKRQDSPFEHLHLVKEQMLNRHIKTRCTGGFEIYKTMLCGVFICDINSTISLPELDILLEVYVLWHAK